MLEHANINRLFDLIDHDLVFDNASNNKIQMNHMETVLCDNFIWIYQLERLKLLQNNPLINELAISIKEPETVSRNLRNFSNKTAHMLQETHFKVFTKLLSKKKSLP